MVETLYSIHQKLNWWLLEPTASPFTRESTVINVADGYNERINSSRIHLVQVYQTSWFHVKTNKGCLFCYGKYVWEIIVQSPLPLTPFLKRGGVNFHYAQGVGGIWKIKKRGGSMVQEQVFLKGTPLQTMGNISVIFKKYH